MLVPPPPCNGAQESSWSTRMSSHTAELHKEATRSVRYQSQLIHFSDRTSISLIIPQITLPAHFTLQAHSQN